MLALFTGTLAGLAGAVARGGLLRGLATLVTAALPQHARKLDASQAEPSAPLSPRSGGSASGSRPQQRRLAFLRTAAAGAAGAVAAAAAQATSLPLLAGATPALLALLAVRVALSARLFDRNGKERMAPALLAAAALPLVGYYAAAFGPGPGTLLLALHAALRGCQLLRTGTHTKALEGAAGWGATAAFMLGGTLSLSVWVAARVGSSVGTRLGGYVAAWRGSAA